ncbi:hypothetical protein FUA23_20680 [Neolewinella aurantiaca]|uniref:Uncharacterized protein n=1 Tax=Neolewinella aurantiaca TaxID=2602767 RepID=A0A5C7F780_9BACT|nr:hypothetical protein [Neolewinella aurantiaca]TXF85430.1 hypothetical protein FUA23_20680 [Neolewinella aurantiaca]
MQKLLLALSIAYFLSACASEETNPPIVVETNEVLPSTVTKNPQGNKDLPLTDDEAITRIRAFFQKVSSQRTAGTLKSEEVEYACEGTGQVGVVTFYSDAGGVVLVENEYGMGDHAGQTDQWYFIEGKLAFLYAQAGTWQFGGAMTKDQDGNEVPGTIDKITENRYYFNDGVLVKHLTKYYEIESGKEEVDPNNVPNETVPHNGETPESYDFIAAFMATRTPDCGLIE